MAWNKPTSNTVDATSSSRPSGRGKMPRLRRGLIAGAIVVLGAGLAAWLLTNGEAASSPLQKKDRGLIKEVTPAAAPKAETPKPKKRKPKFPGAPLDWDKPYPPEAYWPDGRLKEHSMYVKIVTNTVNKTIESTEEATFKNIAEKDIALMLAMEPGDGWIGDGPVFDKSFVKHFLKSLETPIKITEEDSDYQVDLKKAVIETKKDLKARYDAGEDIAQIMNDTVKQFRELSLYRQELEDEVARLRKENKGVFSDSDIRDLINGANQMLEDRGAKPLEATEIFENKMRLKAARLEAKGQESKGEEK